MLGRPLRGRYMIVGRAHGLVVGPPLFHTDNLHGKEKMPCAFHHMKHGKSKIQIMKDESGGERISHI